MLVTILKYQSHQHSVLAQIPICGLKIGLYYLGQKHGVKNGPKWLWRKWVIWIRMQHKVCIPCHVTYLSHSHFRSILLLLGNQRGGHQNDPKTVVTEIGHVSIFACRFQNDPKIAVTDMVILKLIYKYCHVTYLCHSRFRVILVLPSLIPRRE